MKLDWKTCFRICASVFVLYLCIFYWESLAGLIGMFLSALSPIVLGLVIAYVLNILMSFYEKHYFPKQKSKTAVAKSRTIVCLLVAILTLCAIVAMVVGLVVPELVSCVKFLLAEVEPALDRLLSRPGQCRRCGGCYRYFGFLLAGQSAAQYDFRNLSAAGTG